MVSSGPNYEGLDTPLESAPLFGPIYAADRTAHLYALRVTGL